MEAMDHDGESDGTEPRKPRVLPYLPGDLPFLDSVPGIVALVGPEGEIGWISGSVEEITGFTPVALVGTNMFDYIDLDWNPLTLESIGFAVENPGRRLPTLIRFATKDGSGVVMEAMANNQFETPEVGALVVHLRPCAEQQILEEILEATAAGAAPSLVIEKMHALALAETLRSESAVVLLSPELAATGAVLTMNAAVSAATISSDPRSPWERAVASAAPVLVADIRELPDPVRAAAMDQGYRACWAYPVPRPRAGDVAAVLVFWRREAGLPEPNAISMADRLVRLMALMIERFEHLGQLNHAASHDALTGLANRARFFEHVDEHLARGREPVGVLYLDLDGFKSVNDRRGHGVGDRVLAVVAERIRDCVRDGDLVARVGGDEFAVSCPGASTADLVLIAERVLAAVPEAIAIGTDQIVVGTTIGLSSATRASCSADLLVASADAGLLSAKVEGKGCWREGPLPSLPSLSPLP